MSLTMPIPKALRDEMDADPFYHRCCLTGEREGPYNKIDWHHNFMWAGKRVNEKWCILPVSKDMHDMVHRPGIRDSLNRIMLNRADDATLRKYSKVVDLIKRRDQLNKIYDSQRKHTKGQAGTDA